MNDDSVILYAILMMSWATQAPEIYVLYVVAFALRFPSCYHYI